jgi:hypothetical protein
MSVCGIVCPTSRLQDYVRLFSVTLEEFGSESKLEVNKRRKDSQGFSLWKSAKPGEPYRESSWESGRPGWHIEGTDIDKTHLGPNTTFTEGATTSSCHATRQKAKMVQEKALTALGSYCRLPEVHNASPRYPSPAFFYCLVSSLGILSRYSTYLSWRQRWQERHWRMKPGLKR